MNCTSSSPPVPAANEPDALVGALRHVVTALSALYVAVYVAIACLRMPYPFEFEWLEGSFVDHVQRILAGKSLYVAPSLDFVSWLYGPVYFYVSAAVARLTGIGLFPLRLVSLAASLGCFAMLFLMVKRETASNFAAGLGVGLFAACYRAAGAWFDIARVDSLALFLLLAGVYLLQLDAALLVCIAAALLVTLSFLTKQMALAMALPLMLWSLRYQGRRGLAFAGTAVITAGISVMLLSHLTGGWSDYYLFRLPRQRLVPPNIIGFWTNDLMSVLPIACAFAVYFLTVQLKQARRRSAFFWLAAVVGFFAGSWASRVHLGGWLNVLMPAYAIAAAVAAIGAHTALTRANNSPLPTRRRVAIAVYLLCIVQFGVLAYDPARQVPSAQDRQAGELLVAIMRQVKGDVLVLDHGYLSALAGKQAHTRPFSNAVQDFMYAGDNQHAAQLVDELELAVRHQRFGAIVADAGTWLPPDIRTYYTPHRLPFNADAFWPLTGVHTRPEVLYLRKPLPPVRSSIPGPAR